MLYRLLFLTSFLFSYSSISAQCISGRCTTGNGIYKYDDGSRYQGKFIKRKRSGRGKMIYANRDIYIGNWKSNQRHGKGELRFADGKIYKGSWQNNFAWGKGELSFTNGERYVGNFVGGKMQGKGSFFYKDGTSYRGDWEDNKRHGKGMISLADGSKELVSFNMGQKVEKQSVSQSPVVSSPSYENTENVGNNQSQITATKDCFKQYCNNEQGRYVYVNGAVYTGWFKDGQPNGEGICRYPNGDVYKGEWEYHGPHGEGVFSFANGKVIAAEWNRAQMVRQLNKPSRHIDILADNKSKTGDGKANIWAVIVGVASYNHMPSLRYTDDDAYRFYAFLKSPEGGAIPDNQIKILVDESATKSKILLEMQTLYMKADADDVVMFYFSGHGLDGSFIPSDYDGYNNQLYHSELNQVLDATPAKFKVCFADACHAGSYDVADRSSYSSSLDNFYTSFTKSNGGTALLLSSKAEEVSLEYSGLRQGIFSHFLMRGLAGESNVNNDSIISLGELADYVQREVKKYTAGKQSPRTLGKFDRAMPVAMIR